VNIASETLTPEGSRQDGQLEERDQEWEDRLAEDRAARVYFPHLAATVRSRESDEYPSERKRRRK